MLLELLIYSIFMAWLILMALWMLTSLPKEKLVRKAPLNDEKRYTKYPFKASEVPENPDVIVIGSGMGGSTAASILSKQGKKVLVLEHHGKLGGCTHTFGRSGANINEEGRSKCEFDTGCYYTAVDMSLDTARAGALMKYITEGYPKWNNLGDPYDRLVLPFDDAVDPGCPNNDTYEFLCGKNRLVKEIAKQINPNESLVPMRLQKFLEFCRHARNTIMPMFFVRMCPRWAEPLLNWMTNPYYRYGKLTTGYCLSAMIEHGFSEEEVLREKPLPENTSVNLPNTWRRLKGVMVHPLGDYACQPSESSVVAHALTACYYLNGAAYTHGATQNIANSVAKVVYEHGGQCFVRAYVDEIIIKNNRAVGVRVCNSASLASDQKPKLTEIYAPVIINAAGIHNLYNKLLPQDMRIVEEFKKTNTTIPSFGHNYLFVAIKGDADEIGIPKTNTWYINGYETDECFENYFENPTETRPPTCYIGFPCTKDPTWKQRNPGISNCILISDAKYEWFERWGNSRAHKRGDDYEQYKDKFAQKLLEILYEKVPQVKDKILWYEGGTPLTDVSYLHSYRGGSYGTRCNLQFSSRESSRWIMRADTEIDGLYMAGQDAWLPSIAGAMYGGLLGAIKVIGFWKGIGVLMSVLRQQATDIQKKTGWNYSICFAKAVQIFCGGKPVEFGYSDSEWGG